MITDKDVTEATRILAEAGNKIPVKETKALLVLVGYIKHQMLRKERERNGQHHLNREEDAVQRLADMGLNIPDFTKH